MQQFQVSYEILTEERTDSFMGSTNTQLMNLTTVVTALSSNQAREIVEAMYGGYSRCRTFSAYPI